MPVQRGHTLDGLGRFYRETITESDEEPVDVAAVLRDTRADVLVSYLPVGSEAADRFYAQAAIDAGVAFVNALPVFIASDPVWAEKFRVAGVPIVGDDIKSQVGATITHRVLAKLFEDRGVQLDRTMQLNVGGNMDFLNMKELERLESKKVSKTQSVTSQVDRDLGRDNVHIGPSDYVAWLDDRKWAYVRLEGRAFGDVPLNLEYKLEVWDSPNSAGIIIDAVRAAKLALDRGIGGPILSASSYFMKCPPEQYSDDVARDAVEAFIRGRDFVTFPDPNHFTIGGTSLLVDRVPGISRNTRVAIVTALTGCVLGVMEKGRYRFVMCRAASQTVVQPGRRVWGHRRSPSLPGACGAHLEDLRARFDPVPGDPRRPRGDRDHRRRPPHAAPRGAARHPVDGGGRAGGRERPGPLPGGAPRPRHNAPRARRPGAREARRRRQARRTGRGRGGRAAWQRDGDRDGQARRPLPLGRRGPRRLRLLRPRLLVLPPGRHRRCPAAARPSRRSARPWPRAPCSPATWCSSTARSATSRSTSATAASCTPARRAAR